MGLSHKPRHKGTKWAIVYGSYDGIEKFALNELQRMVQGYLPYVLEVRTCGKGSSKHKQNLILIGTPDNNRMIEKLVRKGLVTIPVESQGYSIACFDSPWSKGKRIVVLTGGDAHGVLYGVEDFNARILAARVTPDNPAKMHEAFDGISDFNISEYPLIENRGIWTWGYVIYDYRRFIDNMARLKFNMLTIWNDSPPINCGEVIEYAHSRGIKVILGFHWGWGLTGIDVTKPEHRNQIKDMVLRDYKENYQHLDMDGIYFQTLTEHQDVEIDGISVAAAVCELVNDISASLYEEKPDLYIQFGIHATAIAGNYPDLKPLDPRIVLVWEDTGVIPYSYEPITGHSICNYLPKEADSPEKTIDYSKKLATFRGKTEFAIVAKGWITLRWGDDFEHHGPFVLGEQRGDFIRNRLRERQPRWDRIDALWLKNYPLAARFYREMLDCSPATMTVTGLVEDGMFEETIQLSVAIFAQTIWNPRTSDQEILQLALSPYYT